MPLDNLSIGEEFVKKVEVFYCEVCRRHLNRTEPLEKVVDLHCRSQAHHRAMEERGANDLKNDRFEEDLDQDDPVRLDFIMGLLGTVCDFIFLDCLVGSFFFVFVFSDFIVHSFVWF